MRYVTNVRAWWSGFDRFGEIKDWKPGWGPDRLKWRLLYTFDHGTRVLTGGAVVTWSRWWYDRRQTYGHAGFMTRVLNRFDEQHGARSGGPLWGSEDTAGALVGGLLFWTAVAGLVAWLIWALLT